MRNTNEHITKQVRYPSFPRIALSIRTWLRRRRLEREIAHSEWMIGTLFQQIHNDAEAIAYQQARHEIAFARLEELKR